jgi:hypothetical protein
LTTFISILASNHPAEKKEKEEKKVGFGKKKKI